MVNSVLSGSEQEGTVKQHGVITYPNTVGVRLSDEHTRKLKELAEIDDRPPSVLARRLLVEGIERAAAAAVPA